LFGVIFCALSMPKEAKVACFAGPIPFILRCKSRSRLKRRGVGESAHSLIEIYANASLRQLHAFLDGFLICNAKIKGIGPAKQADFSFLRHRKRGRNNAKQAGGCGLGLASKRWKSSDVAIKDGGAIRLSRATDRRRQAGACRNQG